MDRKVQIWIDRQIDGQKDKQIDNQIDKQMYRQIDKQIDEQLDGETMMLITPRHSSSLPRSGLHHRKHQDCPKSSGSPCPCPSLYPYLPLGPHLCCCPGPSLRLCLQRRLSALSYLHELAKKRKEWGREQLGRGTDVDLLFGKQLRERERMRERGKGERKRERGRDREGETERWREGETETERGRDRESEGERNSE